MARNKLIVESLVEALRDWDLEPEEASNFLEDAKLEYRDDYERRAEEAWARQQESGGPDDTSYRRDMKNAGRGHLLR